MNDRFDWHKNFTERQVKEIKFCLLYDTDDFRHGTDGHNPRMIIAEMAIMLNCIQLALEETNNEGIGVIMGLGE